MGIEVKIKQVIEKYKLLLDTKIIDRVKEMEQDNKDHYLIYLLLGITKKDGELIDLYQNKGRFLYKYAGSLLEELTILCLKEKYPQAQVKVKIPNTIGSKPKTFEIDCLINNMAYEIKWRDATTDGDHITKEHTRIKVIKDKGYTPVRIMYYYPNREQAIKIQGALETLYKGVEGYYYSADKSWKFLHELTDVNLQKILKDISKNLL